MDDSSLIMGQGMTSQEGIDVDVDIMVSVEDILLDVELHMQISLLNQMQQAISQTLESVGHVANLMPTGSLLAFQLISPILSSQGRGDECGTFRRAMTAGVVALCGLSSVLLSFTDSVKGRNGNVCHGLATFRGLWIFDAPVTLPPKIAAKYKLKFTDFARAFLSFMVFAAAVMFDQNIVNCFYPSTAIEEKKVFFTALPLGIGVICCILFLLFPTKRRGIGFPVTRRGTSIDIKCRPV